MEEMPAEAPATPTPQPEAQAPVAEPAQEQGLSDEQLLAALQSANLGSGEAPIDPAVASQLIANQLLADQIIAAALQGDEGITDQVTDVAADPGVANAVEEQGNNEQVAAAEAGNEEKAASMLEEIQAEYLRKKADHQYVDGLAKYAYEKNNDELLKEAFMLRENLEAEIKKLSEMADIIYNDYLTKKAQIDDVKKYLANESVETSKVDKSAEVTEAFMAGYLTKSAQGDSLVDQDILEAILEWLQEHPEVAGAIAGGGLGAGVGGMLGGDVSSALTGGLSGAGLGGAALAEDPTIAGALAGGGLGAGVGGVLGDNFGSSIAGGLAGAGMGGALGYGLDQYNQGGLF